MATLRRSGIVHSPSSRQHATADHIQRKRRRRKGARTSANREQLITARSRDLNREDACKGVRHQATATASVRPEWGSRGGNERNGRD